MSTFYNSPPTYRTATADGRYMAKILSTFSKMEQSRFEAFKRVSFPCNAISRYVAHCLAERQQQARQLHQATNPKSTKVFANTDNTATATPQLQDLVVPGQEEEITTVVATLAKAYAQRLCAAAKAQSQVQQQQQQGTTTTNNNNDSSETPLQPEHVLQAFYARQQQGQDPGFFLQANESITLGGAHTSTSTAKEQMKRVATLAAQEDFDRVYEEYKEFLEKNPPSKAIDEEEKPTTTAQPAVATAAAAALIKTGSDDDSDSGDEEEMDLGMELEKELSGL